MSEDMIYRDPEGKRISEQEWTERVNQLASSGEQSDYQKQEDDGRSEERAKQVSTALHGSFNKGVSDSSRSSSEEVSDCSSLLLDDDADYDFEDVDCADCGLKFYIRPSLYTTGKPLPTQCGRCEKGLAPLYEY